jgi:hypothetical protein
MEPKNLKFGKWLSRQIEERLLTHADFARRCGVSRVSVSHWTCGWVIPNGVGRSKIARALSISRDEVDAALQVPRRTMAA